MIRSRVIVDSKPLDNLIGFAGGFEQVVTDLIQETFDEVRPHLLDELQHYPEQQAVHPFVWSHNEQANARARRYYFWAVNQGIIPTDGNRYVRQYKFRDSWKVDLDNTAGTSQVIVSNSYRGTRYIVGSFDQRRDYQIPGHKTTGWLPVRETIKFWQEAIIEGFAKRFKQFAVSRGTFSTRITNR